MNRFRRYILFWLSQSLSQLGSAMTGFALILWTYEQSGRAMSVSLMSFCSYVPYVLVSLFAGAFVDRHSKKAIMLTADSIAAMGTLTVLAFAVNDRLTIWNIYAVNAIIGFMNAFQSPACAVAVGRMVPQEKLSNVSGMNSFSSSLVSVLSPVIAAFLFAVGGLSVILLIDICTFLCAFFVLAFMIHIPEDYSKEVKDPIWSGAWAGFCYLRREKGLRLMVLTMALINFFSRLTYENILSPMILARSGNDRLALGIVNAIMGVGGIAGGILVSCGKGSKNSARMIYVSAALSFLFGDLLMAVGRSALVWSAAGIAASLPIPFIMAGQNVIIYRKVPKEMQGRFFAVRNAIQFSTIPLGILLGGILADYVFEPFMQSEGLLSRALSLLTGKGPGSGMALMFLCTGALGFAVSLLSYRKREIKELSFE